MALTTIPAGTLLGSSTYPHRLYHRGIEEVRYAHPSGNNSNDGLSWGTAKADVVSAYDALPALGGTIYVADETPMDSVTATNGLWLAGSGDVNFASLPSGWRQSKTLRLVGAPMVASSNSRGPKARVYGGSGTDRTKPTVWISSNAGANMDFENLLFQYPAVAWRIGIESDGTAGTEAVSITLRNCGWNLNQVVGNGPGMDVGYVYWVNMYDCAFRGNPAYYPITAATRSGTTATVTIGTHYLKVGDTVFIYGVTPSGYNGLWTVTAVAATTFTCTLTADPGGSGTVFGYAQPVRSYRRAAIAHDAIDIYTPMTRANRIVIENSNFNSGGFHYASAGAQGGGFITMRNITHEGDFSSPEPPTLHVRGVYGENGIVNVGAIFLQNVEIADAAAPAYGCAVDGWATSAAAVTAINTSVSGNATVIGVDATDHRQMILTEGAVGAHLPAVTRSFGAAPALWANSATQDVSTWSGLNGAQSGASNTVTTGISAPDGTALAARMSGGSNGGRRVGWIANTPGVGDWVIAGIWRRYVSGSADNWNHAQMMYSATGLFLNNGTTNYILLDGPTGSDDGSWVWSYAAGKVTATGGGVGNLYLDARNVAGAAVDYYAPLLVYVTAANAYDEDEMWEIARSLRSWPDEAPAGSVSTLRGQKLIARGGIGVGNSASATTPGSVVKKMEVFDASGASLGFVPIYSSIT